METLILPVFGDIERDREAIGKAGRILKEGGLVAIPTETVYGLAGDALKATSARKIYEAKGRPSDNPLIVHISKAESLNYIAEDIPEGARLLMERYWPGPLTIIFKKKDIVPFETTGGLDTVAVRMPSNPVAQETIEAGGGFLAAPSANKSGRPSCTTAAHVAADMSGRIPLILDGGPVGIGLESTIVDFSEDIPSLLRPGYISFSELRELLGNINIDPNINGAISPDIAPKAPGMKYRHYAPKGELKIVRGSADCVTAYINSAILKEQGEGIRTAVIASTEHAALYDCPLVKIAGSLHNEEEIGKNIFAILREMDSLNVESIYSEAFDTPKLGMAIMNRLLRAAAHKIIEL